MKTVFCILFTSFFATAVNAQIAGQINYDDPTGLFSQKGKVLTFRHSHSLGKVGRYESSIVPFMAYNADSLDIIQAAIDFPQSFAFKKDSVAVRTNSGGSLYESFDRWKLSFNPGFLFAENAGGRSFFRYPTTLSYSFPVKNWVNSVSTTWLAFRPFEKEGLEPNTGYFLLLDNRITGYYEDWTFSLTGTLVGAFLNIEGDETDVTGLVGRIDIYYEKYRVGMQFLKNKVVYNSVSDERSSDTIVKLYKKL